MQDAIPNQWFRTGLPGGMGMGLQIWREFGIEAFGGFGK